MAEVKWTARAVRQLYEIESYISLSDPAAATRLIARLTALGNSLNFSPHRGRAAGSGYRELVSVRPYILRYRVEGEQVFILRVRHSARRQTDKR